MSKIAEQRALDIYPEKTVIVYGPYPTTEPSQIDDNKCYRDGFIKGYELAEKDLALTWQDMQLIWQLCDILNSEQPNLCSSKDFFTEVLNRFNKSKEK